MSENKVSQEMLSEFDSKLDKSLKRVDKLGEQYAQMTPEEQTFYKEELESIKDTFVELIAENKTLQTERIEAIQKYQAEMAHSVQLLKELQSRNGEN